MADKVLNTYEMLEAVKEVRREIAATKQLIEASQGNIENQLFNEPIVVHKVFSSHRVFTEAALRRCMKILEKYS